MDVKFTNNGHSTLAASASTSDTSITVASGHGARFPSLSGSAYFFATLIDASNNLEIVKCTARSSDVLTITRAQESTTARAFAIGDRIELRVTAAGLGAIYSEAVADATPAADSIVNSMIATDAVNADSIVADAVGASELNVSGNGSSGQVLASDGDGTMSWADAGGGSIVQAKFSNQTGSNQSGSGTTVQEVSSTFRITITPTSSSNKILVFAAMGFAVPSGSRMGFMLYRSTNGGSSFSRCDNIGESHSEMYRNASSGQMWHNHNVLLTDSSPSTSSTIYTIYFEVNTSTGWGFGDNTGIQQVVLMEVEPS